jgi:hypothetical protein
LGIYGGGWEDEAFKKEVKSEGDREMDLEYNSSF